MGEASFRSATDATFLLGRAEHQGPLQSVAVAVAVAVFCLLSIRRALNCAAGLFGVPCITSPAATALAVERALTDRQRQTA